MPVKTDACTDSPQAIPLICSSRGSPSALLYGPFVMRYHGSEEIAVQVVIQPGAAHIFEHSLHYAVYPAGVFAHVFTAIFYVIAAAQRVLKIFYALSLF